MNTNDVNEMLFQAELALKTNDKKDAAKILSQILIKDINNDPAWKLLYQLYESKQPFEEFQTTLAKKYFPNHLHLLVQKKDTPPANIAPPRQEIPGVISPILAAKSVPIHSSELQTPTIKCTYCGKLVFKESKFCAYCGNPINSDTDRIIAKHPAITSIPETSPNQPQKTPCYLNGLNQSESQPPNGQESPNSIQSTIPNNSNWIILAWIIFVIGLICGYYKQLNWALIFQVGSFIFALFLNSSPSERRQRKIFLIVWGIFQFIGFIFGLILGISGRYPLW